MEKFIADEFEQFSNIDYKSSYSIGRVCEVFGHDSDISGGKRGFMVEKRGLPYSIKRLERVKLFSEYLFENGNIEYAQKNTGISKLTAIKYVKYLNEKAIEMGYPAVYHPKRRKEQNILNAKQVSFIKYLCTKYSCVKISKMYKVSAATIFLIKSGKTWKEIPPIIINDHPLLLINQYGAGSLNKNRTYKICYIKNKWCDCDLVDSIRFIENIKYPTGEIECPYCGIKPSYRARRGHRYRCRSKHCALQFQLTSLTKFHKSLLPINKILAAIYSYIVEAKVSASGLSEMLNLRQATCYYLLRTIKETIPKKSNVHESDIDFYFKKAVLILFTPVSKNIL